MASPAWIPYSQNSEWLDILPTPIYHEGPYPFAPIAFSEEYMDTMAYYLKAKDETSSRLFDLTTHLLTLNPALYCVWHTRERLLFELNLDLRYELEWLSQLLLDSPKNFQMWHHRQVVMQALEEPSNELDFFDQIFELDAKNYHAWIYLQWLVRTFALWSSQEQFVNHWIDQDVRNHSAWTHRYFLLENGCLVPDQEVKYTLDKLRLALSNESAWTYLQGLDVYLGSPHPSAIEFAEACKFRGCVSSYLFGYLVDVYAYQKKFESAIELCQELQFQLDPSRALYWKYRQQRCRCNKEMKDLGN